MGFPNGYVVKESACNARDSEDMGLIPGSRRSPGEGNGNPLQSSCLENLINRGAWQAIVHGVTKGQTQFNNSTTTCLIVLNISYEFQMI